MILKIIFIIEELLIELVAIFLKKFIPLKIAESMHVYFNSHFSTDFSPEEKLEKYLPDTGLAPVTNSN